MNRLTLGFVRVLGLVLIGVGLLGVVWPFTEEHLLAPPRRSPVADAFTGYERIGLLSHWLSYSAPYWPIVGLGALICALTTPRFSGIPGEPASGNCKQTARSTDEEKRQTTPNS